MSTVTRPSTPPQPSAPQIVEVRPSLRQHGKQAPRRRRGWSIGLLLLVLILLAAGGTAFTWWYFHEKIVSPEIAVPVRRAMLPILVGERGELESAKQTDVRCEVEGYQNKIVTILPEGVRVKKDDVVVVFDADQLKQKYADQEVKVKQAEGKAKAAKGELEVQKNKAETDFEKAKLDLTLAELDQKKYLKGDYKVEVDDKKGALALAKRNLQEAKEKLEHHQTLYKKGFIPLEQLRLKEAELDQKKYEVDRDEAKLMVLEVFTKERQLTELDAKAKEAKRAVERARKTGEATIDKTKSDLEAAQVTERLEKATLATLQRQLDNCTVKAPQDGILVYSKERWYDDNSRIQAGSMVHFRQGLFSLPDLSKMRMKVKIHEAMVKKVKAGQKAEVRLDAYPNLIMHGTVSNVATMASMDGWYDRSVKEYDTIVDIDDLPLDAGLKPGMTGDVKILVKQLSDVLIVPVQAVGQKEGSHFCFLAGPKGIEKCEVEVGDNNDKFVEIKSGLKEGEQVTLDARARIAAELKAREGKADDLPKGFGSQAPKAEEKPAKEENKPPKEQSKPSAPHTPPAKS
ncbi:MAG TPA: efflux RND transporter periplasmic adaptor subunit [Gemmataceae bacterium]|nr:efflux RND transporter periplasmic adaptor subunit [Gemmataceae bacterium]